MTPECARGVVKHGLAQIETGDETRGLKRLEAWIVEGKPLITNGELLDEVTGDP